MSFQSVTPVAKKATNVSGQMVMIVDKRTWRSTDRTLVIMCSTKGALLRVTFKVTKVWKSS